MKNKVDIERDKEYKKTLMFFQKMLKVFAPPPKLTISQWADKYRKLSPESSAEPGTWNTDRAPYQREIMDAISDINTHTVIIKSSAQVGKSEILLNTLGYYIAYEPGPILYIMPTEGMGKEFSEERLGPMIRDSEALKDKVYEVKSRDSGNTIMHKKFKGGHLTLIGANTPNKLSSKPIKVVLMDEVDRYPFSAGKEGDPVKLAIKRTTTFWNRKIVLVSTPTIKGISKIDNEYEDSTAEELNVMCPNCKEYQPLIWEQLKFEHEKGTQDFELNGYMCIHCGFINNEKIWKYQPIKWIATHPEVKGKRGFHLNELISPWKSWNEIIADFLDAKRKGIEALKTWRNTSLGLSWEEQSELDIQDKLLERRQYYNCDIPKDVLVLTCGVDVQDNRLEYEIIGWGLEKSSWGIKYGVIMGDISKKQVQQDLDDVLSSDYDREDGLKLNIMTTCIDSGGHYTDFVYDYCKKREMKRVWAIKGQGGTGIPYIQRPKRRNKAGVFLFMLGTDVGKDTIASRLRVEFENESGFCHFPMEIEKGYDKAYFEGLTAEKRHIRSVNGQMKMNWVKKYDGIRNEPFDIRNYATAALEILNPNLDILYKKLNVCVNQNQNVNTPVKKKKSKGSSGVSIY